MYPDLAENNSYVLKILELLSDRSLRDQIEIIANVLIEMGFSGISTSENTEPNDIVKIVLKDKINKGETLFNSLALQGLTMLIWLQSE